MRSTEAAEPAEDEDDKYIRELERKRIEAQKARARFDLRASITMVRTMGYHKFKLRSYHAMAPLVRGGGSGPRCGRTEGCWPASGTYGSDTFATGNS